MNKRNLIAGLSILSLLTLFFVGTYLIKQETIQIKLDSAKDTAEFDAALKKEFPLNKLLKINIYKKLESYGYRGCAISMDGGEQYFCKEIGNPCEEARIVRYTYPDESENPYSVSGRIEKDCEIIKGSSLFDLFPPPY